MFKKATKGKKQPTKNTVTDKITSASKKSTGKSKSKKFNAGAFAAAKKKVFGMK